MRPLAPSLVAIRPGTAHPYFDALARDPRCRYAWALRSDAEIASYRRPTVKLELPQVYDAAMDACLLQIDTSRPEVQAAREAELADPTLPVTSGSANEPAQVWLPMAIPFGTSFLQTFDQCWDGGWKCLNDDYHAGFKSLRFDCAQDSEASTLCTLKHYFGKGKIPADVDALLVYKIEAGTGWRFRLDPTRVESEVIQPQTYFYLQPDRWMRTWLYYDAALQELSLWALDRTQELVCLLDRVKWGFPSMGLKQWRLQFDTSQDHEPVLNPRSRAWNRNVAVLFGLRYDEVLPLLTAEGLP